VKALFLADAHLRGSDSPAQAKVLDLLGRIAGPARQGEIAGALSLDLLVLAGDFFDFWFSRGERIFPGFLPVIHRLQGLKEEGIRIVLCEGNHDFHLTDYFASRLGLEVYRDAVDLALDGQRILVAHGDTVDRHNRSYLALRRFLRSAFAQRLQQRLPLPWLWGLARYSSELSKEMSTESKGRLADLMHAYARRRFEEGYDAVILGHCHKPSLVQEPNPQGAVKTFATLGDWLVHDSYLLYRDGGFALHHR
jgi:UDP-2,3-diacylglucosamine hydrolase